MQPFDWREEYSVGIPELDVQHRHLIELLGRLARRASAGEGGRLASTAIEEVSRYAEWHLLREELVLRVRRYSGYREHKAEHDAYRKKAAALRTHSDRRDFGVRIANFLTEWWRFHILISDQEYARFFRSKLRP